ncbi:unnamed protein product, partial [Cyprideis torosa]
FSSVPSPTSSASSLDSPLSKTHVIGGFCPGGGDSDGDGHRSLVDRFEKPAPPSPFRPITSLDSPVSLVDSPMAEKGCLSGVDSPMAEKGCLSGVDSPMAEKGCLS